MIQGCFQTNWRRCFFPEACISFDSDLLNKNLTFLNNLYVQSAMLALYLLLEGSVCPIVQRDLWDVGFERPMQVASWFQAGFVQRWQKWLELPLPLGGLCKAGLQI